MKYKKTHWTHRATRIVYRNVFVRSPVSFVKHFSPWVGIMTDYADLSDAPNEKRRILWSWNNCFRRNHRNWRGVEG